MKRDESEEKGRLTVVLLRHKGRLARADSGYSALGQSRHLLSPSRGGPGFDMSGSEPCRAG